MFAACGRPWTLPVSMREFIGREVKAPPMPCRVCESDRLLSVLDLGATPPCEKFLDAEALDLVEQTYPLHLRVCENCLLLQLPALITPEETFTEYAYFCLLYTSPSPRD